MNTTLSELAPGTQFRLFATYRTGVNRRTPAYRFNNVSLNGKILTVVAQCPTYTAVSAEGCTGYIPMCPQTSIR